MRMFNNYFMKKYKILLLALIVFGGLSLRHALCVPPKPISQERMEKVQDFALQQEQKRQEVSSGIDNRSLLEIEEQSGANRFTQTEGYFQVPALRNLVTDTFSGSFEPVKHMDIVSRVMAKEAQFKNSHWAFYHGTSNIWMVPQDLCTALYRHLNPSAKKDEEFKFLRFGDESGPQAKEFLTSRLRKEGLVDDNGEDRGLLLSTNLSLFGNTGFQSESTWRYFMKDKKHAAPERATYEEIMDKFGLSHKYIDEIMKVVETELLDLLQAKEQTLLQIFVPKDIVDDIGYLAWATGIPAHEDTINWVRANVKNKNYKPKKKTPGALIVLEDLKNKFKKEQERNPLFKDLVKTVEEGDYSLDSFLKIYCNKPWELPNLNYVQARLIFSNDVLLNPNSGVKMYRYITINRNKMSEYQKRLDAIVKKIVADKGQ